MKRLMVALGVFTLLAAGTQKAAAQDFVLSISFDGGGWFDRSFNEGTWAGISETVRSLSATTDFDILIYNGAPETTTQGVRNLAEAGSNLHIAAGFSQEESIATVAAEFPWTSFLLIDGVAAGDNVRSVTFKDHEGSYLVGYLAGLMSQTGVVGFVGGMDVPLIRNFAQGYQLGVEAACAACTVLSENIGDTFEAWNDPVRARELASDMHAAGADIIYAAAGDSGNGVIEFVNDTRCYMPQQQLRSTPLSEVLSGITRDAQYDAACPLGSQPLFFIGVDSNQNYLGDLDGDPATMNHGLTSMLKRVDVVAGAAINDVVSGVFTSGWQELGLADNAVGYALDEYNEALLPQPVRDQLDQVRERIIQGELQVPPYAEE